MSAPLKTGFPDGHTLSADYIIRFRAVDPTTGADVSGVTISGASVFADTGGQVQLEDVPPFMWVPGSEA